MTVQQAMTIVREGLTFDIVRQSRLLPTIEVLNTFFECGVDDTQSGSTIEWDSFTLTDAEYDVFVQQVQELFGDCKVDALGFDNYSGWFCAVAERNVNR